MADITVDALLAELDRSESKEKVAFSRGDVEDAATTELLEKVASEMDAGEIRKAAAAAKLSGNIMADVILEKIASQLAPATANAVHEKIASLLPEVVASVVPAAVNYVLEKLAVGTSSAISGYLTKQVPNDESANAHQIANDKVGRGMADRTSKYWGAERTSGATVEGGGQSALDGGAGEKPEAWEPVHKLSAAKSKINQYLKKHEMEKDAYLKSVFEDPSKTLEDFKHAQTDASDFMKAAHVEVAKFAAEMGMPADPGMMAAGGGAPAPAQGGGGPEADIARYQELQAKKAAGALTPEEEQELQMLEQKLMAMAGAAQQGAGAPAGGPPGEAGPPGGGMPGGSMGDKMAGAKASKDDIKRILARAGLRA